MNLHEGHEGTQRKNFVLFVSFVVKKVMLWEGTYES
jgi:hypothetical protein